MKITAAEAQIMEALWSSDGPLAVEEVRDRLAEDWADGTVRAFLNRLLKKKAVAATKDGKRSLYRPLVARADYVHAESKTLLDRLFDGQIETFVTHFSEREDLTPQQVERLRQLVEALGNDR